jgi:hypothetical protein
MVRESESDASGHTSPDGTQNRRQLLATLTSTAIAGGLGTASVAATRDRDAAVSRGARTRTTLAEGEADIDAVMAATERTGLREELEADGFSLQPDRAAVYAIETAELSASDPAAVLLPLEATTEGTPLSSEPLFGLVCAATTADQDDNRVVSTVYGIGIEKRPSMFSWFTDERYSATMYYPEEPAASATGFTSQHTGSPGKKTVGVDHEEADPAALGLTQDADEEKSDACTICTGASTLVCQALDQLGPFLCELACGGNGICENVCPVLTDIVAELLCENKEEFCELISACEDGDESNPDDGSSPGDGGSLNS